MSFSKLITIIITQIFLFTVCFGQRKTIDSLRRLLPSLHDSARVDCLNNISEVYIGLPSWFAARPEKTKMDTAEIIAIQAQKEAIEINYLYGIAKAISIRAELAFEKDSFNFQQAESLSREAISLYKRSTNKKGLNRSYWRLGTALHSLSIFDAALRNYDTCYALSNQSGDSLYIFYSVVTAANVCYEKGDYTTSFEKLLVLHQLVAANTDVQWKDWELQISGDLYFAFEDFNTALKYYQEKQQKVYWDSAHLTKTFALNKQFDSARKYFNDLVTNHVPVDTGNAFVLTFLGEYYLLVSDYDKALPNLLKGLHDQIQDNDVNQIMRLLIDIAKTHHGLRKNDSAFKYAHEALGIANRTGAKQINRDACKILSFIYDYSGRPDSAYFYYKRYVVMKDSVLNDQVKGKLAGFAFEQKIELLNKEKEIQQVRLQKESLRKNILIAGAFVFLLIAFLLWRNNRHKQKAYLLLQKQQQETDIQKTKVEEALHELKTTQAQLIQSEKMASLGEMTAGIAHEIQNPLNFVNNFSEVNTELVAEMKAEIAKGNMNEVKTIADDIEANQEKINHHGKRADAIVKGMLQHSRTSSAQKESTDINAMADEYLRLAYHGVRAKDKSFNAKIETDFDNSVGKINAIPQDVARVLVNLINNAFYALNEKKKLNIENYEPTVTVSTKKLNDKVEIRVKDNGNGIPQKVLDKIFQPFFTTKPTGQGTGLGLSLAYDIVKAHGGEIVVQTEEGHGSEFTIRLPS